MAWVTGTKHTHWEAHTCCEECGHHQYVAHADLFFGPEYCPECGAEGPYKNFRKLRMKYVYEERDGWGFFSFLLPCKGHWEIHHKDEASAPELLLDRIQ